MVLSPRKGPGGWGTHSAYCENHPLQRKRATPSTPLSTLPPGINAICGENGAPGKSFDPGSHRLHPFWIPAPTSWEAFLREGEEERLLEHSPSPWRMTNGCSFEVVRKLGSGQRPGRYDGAGGQRIAEGEADVRQVANSTSSALSQGTDIAKLFEDAVGPPSGGTLTAIFLESGATRQAEVRSTARHRGLPHRRRYLRPVGNLFRDEAAAADKRAALLEGDARRLPEVEERRAGSALRQAELGQELQGMLGQQEKLAAEDGAAGEDQAGAPARRVAPPPGEALGRGGRAAQGRPRGTVCQGRGRRPHSRGEPVRLLRLPEREREAEAAQPCAGRSATP